MKDDPSLFTTTTYLSASVLISSIYISMEINRRFKSRSASSNLIFEC